MTAHELARKLLEMPDDPVVTFIGGRCYDIDEVAADVDNYDVPVVWLLKSWR
jgi:hypothetical protein